MRFSHFNLYMNKIYKIMRFKEWLNEHASRPGAKQGLYPMGYGGIGLYTPCDMANWSADAITYMPAAWLKPKIIEAPFMTKTYIDERTRQKFIWGKGILGPVQTYVKV